MPLPDTEREKRMSTFAMAPVATWPYKASASRFAKLGIASTWVAMGADQAGFIPRSFATTAAASPDNQDRCTDDVARRRVEDAFAEGTGEALLRAKQDEAESGTPERGAAVISAGSRLKAWPMARETTLL